MTAPRSPDSWARHLESPSPKVVRNREHRRFLPMGSDRLQEAARFHSSESEAQGKQEWRRPGCRRLLQTTPTQEEACLCFPHWFHFKCQDFLWILDDPTLAQPPGLCTGQHPLSPVLLQEEINPAQWDSQALSIPRAPPNSFLLSQTK